MKLCALVGHGTRKNQSKKRSKIFTIGKWGIRKATVYLAHSR